MERKCQEKIENELILFKELGEEQIWRCYERLRSMVGKEKFSLRKWNVLPK